jgi:hypothetical protein
MRRLLVVALVATAAWAGVPAANALCVDRNGVGSGSCPNPPLTDQTDSVLEIVDPTICPMLVTAAPTVDSGPTAGVIYVDPGTGDTYVGGTTADDVTWDCPPYQQ